MGIEQNWSFQSSGLKLRRIAIHAFVVSELSLVDRVYLRRAGRPPSKCFKYVRFLVSNRCLIGLLGWQADLCRTAAEESPIDASVVAQHVVYTVYTRTVLGRTVLTRHPDSEVNNANV